MFAMDTSQPPLPIRFPNPEDWCDQATAVKITGLSRATIHQMAGENPPRLRAYLIGAHRCYWVDEVRELARAVKLVRGRGAARK